MPQSPLSEALHELSHWIETSNSYHATTLRYHKRPFSGLEPGLEREMIDLYAEEMNFPLSEEIYDFYEWHNQSIMLGEWCNSVYSVPLDTGLVWVAEKGASQMPILFGDVPDYVVEPAVSNSQSSRIYCYDGWDKEKQEFTPLVPDVQAPSLTGVFQAAAECARTHDAISVSLMLMDEKIPSGLSALDRGAYMYERRKYAESLLKPIYTQYGIDTTRLCCGLWG